MSVVPSHGQSSPAPRNFAAELVAIPAGSFVMGSEDGDRDERPAHRVNVDGFSMSRTEVTTAWYLRCMADGACEPPIWWATGYFEEIPGDLTAEQRMQLPVTGISWHAAKAFCRWLGPQYDLPSEAEWEYAASSGDNRKYPWGNSASDRYGEAAHGGRKPAEPKRLMPAGSFPPNPWGLQDLATGVWEWTSDCYEKHEANMHSGGPCENRVTKGGSWSEHTWNLRVANKSYGLETEGYKGLGFRVVRHDR